MQKAYKAYRGITYKHIKPLDTIQNQNTIQEHIQKETLQKYVSLNPKNCTRNAENRNGRILTGYYMV